jgi:hypothetical protein
LKAHSFDVINSLNNEEIDISESDTKDFWKNVYLVLNENGTLKLKFKSIMNNERTTSFLKINGFTKILVENNEISAFKP